ncbi:hypothetical protein [Streptomyces sp. NPDC001530]|uniref:hypothetical protein n=1 Tax=Streptomyces sp. NPDC001530 TaxID=3364582 RepID=UPI0036A18A19
MSEQGMEAKFRGDADRVGRYLDYQATKFVERFDAESYLRMIGAMDRFDGFDRIRAAPRGHPAVSLFSFASDRLFGLAHSVAMAGKIAELGFPVSHHHDETSPAGHDAFLQSVPGYLDSVVRALR